MSHFNIFSDENQDLFFKGRYKGTYRATFPCPREYDNPRYTELFYRCCSGNEYKKDGVIGIPDEISLDELKEFLSLCNSRNEDNYEIVFLNKIKECPHDAVYYGIDVSSVGGYSMLGEGLFNNKVTYPWSSIVEVINKYFSAKLNENGLFDRMEDAELFKKVLFDMNKCFRGCIEDENWQIVHIFGLI